MSGAVYYWQAVNQHGEMEYAISTCKKRKLRSQLQLQYSSIQIRKYPLHSQQQQRRILLVWFNQLHILLAQQYTLGAAIKQLAAERKDNRLRAISTTVAAGLHNGQTLSTILAEFPALFPNDIVELISVGEQRRQLDHVIALLIDDWQQSITAQQKLRRALIYPLFLLLTGVMLFHGMISELLPQMASLYSTLGKSLPPAITSLLKLKHVLLPAEMAVVFFILAKKIYSRATITRSRVGRWRNFRFIRRIFLPQQRLRWLTLLILGIDSGLSLLKSWALAENVVTDRRLLASLRQSRETIAAGGTPHEALSQQGDWPEQWLCAFQLSKQQQQLISVCRNLIAQEKSLLDHRRAKLQQAIEPTMIAIIGLVIGGLILLLYAPLLVQTTFSV